MEQYTIENKDIQLANNNHGQISLDEAIYKEPFPVISIAAWNPQLLTHSKETNYSFMNQKDFHLK